MEARVSFWPLDVKKMPAVVLNSHVFVQAGNYPEFSGSHMEGFQPLLTHLTTSLEVK